MRSDWVILHGGALGDLILTLHLAFSIKPLRESGAVYAVSRVDLRPLSGTGSRLKWRSPDSLRTHWLYREDDAPAPAPLSELVRGRRILNCLGDRRTGMHSRLRALGAREVLSLDSRPWPGDERHIVEQWRGQLASQSPALGFEAAPMPLLSAAGTESAPLAGTSRIGGPPVVIHPGGGGAGKLWPIDRFTALGAALLDRGLTVRFLLGPAELERSPDWPALLRPIAAVDECSSVAALVARLRAAALYVGNDSGPGHVAAAIGLPTITLFGPTKAFLWRPMGACAVAISGLADLPGWGIGIPAILREIDSLMEFAATEAGRPRIV